MRKLRFELNPAKFLAHIICPSVLANHIDISKLEVSLSSNHGDKSFFCYLRNNIIELQKSEISVFVDEIMVKNNIDFLKILNANVMIKKDNINVDFIARILGIPIKFNSHIKRVTNDVLDISSIFTLKNKINMIITSRGKINLSSLDVNQSILIEKLEFCTKIKNETKIASNVNIQRVNENSLQFKKLNAKKKSDFNTINLGTLNFNLGDFSLLKTKNSNKVSSVIYIYAPEKKMEITYCENGNYKLRFIVKDKVIGMISGNAKTGEIIANVRNVNIENIPIIPFLFRDIKGTINILGSINRIFGRIDFKFEKFSLSNVNMKNVKGSITRNNSLYSFNFSKGDSSIVLKTIVNDKKIVMANFKFNGINISKMFHTYKYLVGRINGKISGYINYKKDTFISTFKAILYDDNKLKKFEVNGDMDFSKINIKRFVLIDNSGKLSIDIAGVILFKKALNISSVYINMKDVCIGGVKTTGRLIFQNNLNNDNKIKGIIKGNNVKISGVSFENILADAEISSGKFEISNLRSDNGAKGAVLMDFKKNKLSGNLYFKNTNIEGVHPGIRGLLDSIVKFSGKLSSPDINIAISLINGKCLSSILSLSSELTSRNGIVAFDAILFIDKTKFTIKNDCLRNGVFSLTVDNLTEKIMSMFSCFKIPISGHFSGCGIFTIINGRHNLKMSLKAKNAYVEALRLNDVKFDIEMSRGSVSISNASAKVLDSEIKIDEGLFNIENGKYGFNLSLFNIHIGPVDLFGNLKLFGKIIMDDKGCMHHSGIVDLRNLWINGYHLSCSRFEYTSKDKILEFYHKADNFSSYDCSGLIVLDKIVHIKKFNILKDKASFNLNIDSLEDYFDIKAKGLNISWSFITDILNLPIHIEGNADVNINLLGNVGSPKGNIAIASTKGYVMEIPYDNFDVEIDFCDNIITLKKVVMTKLDEINMYVRGSLPFWFNKTLLNKARKKSIDIFYVIEDNKLSILRYLSKGFIKNNSGKMLLEGSITGTCEKANNNASLLIREGSFELKNYIDRVKNMSVEMSIDENSIGINKFNFRSGRGGLNIYGKIGIDNFSIKDFDIRFITDDRGILLSVPQLPIPNSTISSRYLLQDYSTGEPYFDIKMQGPIEKPKISGFVLLKNTRFTFPGNINHKNKRFILPKNTEFDLELRTSEDTKFENSFISALIRGSIFINGFYNNIKSKGVIESSNGIFYYLGYGFNILNAKMEIIDDGKIYVTAECESIRHSKMNDGAENIKLIIPRCNISNLRFNLNYDDPKKILWRVIKTEHDTELNSLKFEPSLDFEIRRQILRLIDQNITTPITRTVLRKIRLVDNFEVSYVQTDDTIPNTDNLTFAKLFWGTKYSIKKNLTDRIFIGYSITFNEFDKRFDLCHDIEVKYKIINNLFLDASYELELGKRSRQKSDNKLMLQYQVHF